MTEEQLQQSYQLVDGVQQWTRDKCFKYPTIQVQTYHKSIKGKHWCGRSNTLQDDDANQWYSKFLKYLIGVDANGELDKLNHTKYEKEYIHSLQSYKVLPIDDPTKKDFILVQLIYDIGPILKKREFVEYILIQPPTNHENYGGSPDEEVSLIVSLPEEKSGSINDNAVRATYESIERVIYNKTTRTIQWDMITNSDAKGNLPLWLQKMGINKSISLDVPSFIDFINNH